MSKDKTSKQNIVEDGSPLYSSTDYWNMQASSP